MKNRTYRYFEGEPLFPFGFGPSYSTLTYDHLKLSNPELDSGNSRQVDAEVSNTGQRDGEEVVELYFDFPEPARRTHPCAAQIQADPRGCRCDPTRRL